VVLPDCGRALTAGLGQASVTVRYFVVAENRIVNLCVASCSHTFFRLPIIGSGGGMCVSFFFLFFFSSSDTRAHTMYKLVCDSPFRELATRSVLVGGFFFAR